MEEVEQLPESDGPLSSLIDVYMQTVSLLSGMLQKNLKKIIKKLNVVRLQITHTTPTVLYPPSVVPKVKKKKI